MTEHVATADEEHAVASLESSRGREITGAIARGVQAGVVATAIMTAFRLPIMRSLPPTANVWARHVSGAEPEDHPLIGLVLHFAYGAGGGAAFGGLFALLDANRSLEAEERGVLWGSIYGLNLSILGSQVVLPGLLDSHPDEDELALFHAAHLVYGVALGAWVGSRTEGVEDPDEEYDYEDDESRPGLGRLGDVLSDR